MDERTKELIAMGASVAANCHPCMDHHLAEYDELKISRQDVREAIKVGFMVNHGAERAIRSHAHELLGELAAEADP
jgi:AhpD family alkylhydroperoxidase